MLDEETKDTIRVLVRSGFYDPDAIVEIVCEEMFEPGEMDASEVSAAVESEFTAVENESLSWPAVTDCDRLDQVFEALNARGVIALQNAGYTQSDGYDDFREAYEGHADRDGVTGYCFYHGQDLERAVHGEGLYLAFGPIDPDDEATKGIEVGETIRKELERAGFKVEWDGTFQQRIFVPEMNWQKRPEWM